MSNEHFDLARRDCGLSFDALRPASEEPTAGRDSLFVVVTNNALAGRPALEEIGYRTWIMAARCFVPVPVATAADKRAMQKIATQCNGGFAVPRTEDAQAVFELILGVATGARSMGRRVTLLGYALNRSVIVREALPNFEEIGKLWELRAANKRSAVCAGMNKLRAELVRVGKLPPSFRFWFEKSADVRAVYEQCQRGNDNRAHGVGESAVRYDKHAAHDVPLKRKFARMSKEAMRHELNRLHEAAERRRLGIF